MFTWRKRENQDLYSTCLQFDENYLNYLSFYVFYFAFLVQHDNDKWMTDKNAIFLSASHIAVLITQSFLTLPAHHTNLFILTLKQTEEI